MSSQPECKICGNYINHGPVICEQCLEQHDETIRKAERGREHEQKSGECTFGQSYDKCGEYKNCDDCMKTEPSWLSKRDVLVAQQERARVLDEVIHDVERMIDAEQERTVDGEYTKDGITKLGILAYVSEHFKSLRGGELG